MCPCVYILCWLSWTSAIPMFCSRAKPPPIQSSRYANTHVRVLLSFQQPTLQKVAKQPWMFSCACSYWIVSSDILKYRLLKWLLDHPMKHCPPSGPRERSNLALKKRINEYNISYSNNDNSSNTNNDTNDNNTYTHCIIITYDYICLCIVIYIYIYIYI